MHEFLISYRRHMSLKITLVWIWSMLNWWLLKKILETIFQAKIQKHQAFEAEVAAHSNAITVLDNTGTEMINNAHFASEVIDVSLFVLFSKKSSWQCANQTNEVWTSLINMEIVLTWTNCFCLNVIATNNVYHYCGYSGIIW